MSERGEADVPFDGRASAVLVAAGSSTRMRATGNAPSERKPFFEVGGRTLLELSCAAFDACPVVEELVLVVHADDLERVRRLAAERPALGKVRAVVPGGAERADSVRIGVRACTAATDVVAVHDAARPLVLPRTIEESVRVACEHGAALVAVPVADTLKRSDDGGRTVARTVDRGALWSAQTPQTFRRSALLEVLAQAEADGFRPTDDAALWERYVGPVAIVPGEATNLKITRPRDMELLRALLAARGGPAEDAR